MRCVHALICVFVLLGAFAGCSSSNPDIGAKPAVMLEGTYRFDAENDAETFDGHPNPEKPESRLYAFRSACGDNGCIATGLRLADNDATQAMAENDPIVLDFTANRWLLADDGDLVCTDRSLGRTFSIWSLTAGPGKSLSGTRNLVRFASPKCSGVFEMPMTLTRVGDVEPGITLADPGSLAALTPSAPLAMRGKYDATMSLLNGDRPTATSSYDFTPACVRNTERCILINRYAIESGTQAIPYRFVDHRWSAGYVGTRVPCKDDPSRSTVPTYFDIISMPTDGADPVTTTSGLRRADYVGDCAGYSQWDSALERTGDNGA